MYKIFCLALFVFCSVLTLAQHNLYFAIPPCSTSEIIVENENSAFQIFPNPASEQLIVNLPNKINFELKIIDINGKIQTKFNTKELNTSLFVNISDLENGFYFIELISKEKIYRKSFIKI